MAHAYRRSSSIHLNHPRLLAAQIARPTRPNAPIRPRLPVIQTHPRPQIALPHNPIHTCPHLAQHEEMVRAVEGIYRVAGQDVARREADSVVRAEDYLLVGEGYVL
jgi:hypothetical protein